MWPSLEDDRELGEGAGPRTEIEGPGPVAPILVKLGCPGMPRTLNQGFDFIPPNVPDS